MSKTIGGGLLAGIIFYVLSVLVWFFWGFLPVVPLSIAIPTDGLGQGWPVIHLIVSLFIGLLWAGGYAVYGNRRPGGWLYGTMIYIVGSLPAFVAQFILSAPLRSIIFYGAVLSLVGALLGGRAIAAIVRK